MTPVTNPKPFDCQFALQLNFYFGRTARRPARLSRRSSSDDAPGRGESGDHAWVGARPPIETPDRASLAEMLRGAPCTLDRDDIYN